MNILARTHGDRHGFMMFHGFTQEITPATQLFETGALCVSHFGGPLWNQRHRLGVGHLGSRNFWFPGAACLLLRSVMNSKQPKRYIFLSVTCLGIKIGAVPMPSPLFGFLVFSMGGCASPSFQVKLELKHGTKNKIPLNGRKIMKDASQQQPPFRNMRTQIEQECFHQDCQMIPIILPSGDIPVRTLSPGYNLTILFAEAEKHLFSDKDGH